MKAFPFALLTLALAVAACSPKESAAPAASSPEPTPVATEASAATTAEAAPVNEVGKKVFGATCSMCHSAGVGGAPKPGDKADWGPRIAQGKDVLYTHAKQGFTGAKGMMPARGGNPKLTDDEVQAAVDFMADQSR